MKTICFRIIDVFLFPFTLLGSCFLLAVRRVGVHELPACKKTLLFVGVFPIRRHYYEPLFDTEPLRTELNQERDLPGIDLNVTEQLELLSKLDYSKELIALPHWSRRENQPFITTIPASGPGDAELLYSMIRHFKPCSLVEIGSGFSTLIARQALNRNEQEVPGYRCNHVCIEPSEEPWLERCGTTVLRERVEALAKGIFDELDENDILFIDSSHMIRPAGDVLCEYLQISPIKGGCTYSRSRHLYAT